MTTKETSSMSSERHPMHRDDALESEGRARWRTLARQAVIDGQPRVVEHRSSDGILLLTRGVIAQMTVDRIVVVLSPGVRGATTSFPLESIVTISRTKEQRARPNQGSPEHDDQ